jgi:hypothetical protein
MYIPHYSRHKQPVGGTLFLEVAAFLYFRRVRNLISYPVLTVAAPLHFLVTAIINVTKSILVTTKSN